MVVIRLNPGKALPTISANSKPTKTLLFSPSPTPILSHPRGSFSNQATPTRSSAVHLTARHLGEGQISIYHLIHTKTPLPRTPSFPLLLWIQWEGVEKRLLVLCILPPKRLRCIQSIVVLFSTNYTSIRFLRSCLCPCPQ